MPRLPVITPPAPPLRPARRKLCLTVISYNIHGLCGSKLELLQYLRRSSPDVVCLQETFHGPHHSLAFRNYGVEHLEGEYLPQDDPDDHRGRRSSGLLILIRRPLHYKIFLRIPLHDTNYCYSALGVELSSPTLPSPLKVVNIYIRPHQGPNPPQLQLELPAANCIVVGDVNGHHPAWSGSTQCDANPQGQEVYTWLREAHYKLLNSIHDPPTFQGQQGTSSIDITAVTKDLLLSCTRHLLENSLAASDHLPQKIGIKTTAGFVRQSGQRANYSRWNYKKADWGKFQRELDKNLDQIDWESSVAHIYTTLTQGYKKAAKTSIPRGNIPIYNSYWNHSLNKLRLSKNRVRRAMNDRKSAGKPYDKLQTKFRRLVNQYLQELHHAKQKSWENFTQSLSSNSRKMWRVVKSMAVGQDRRQRIDVEGHAGREAAQKYATYLSDEIYKSRLSMAVKAQWRQRAVTMKTHKTKKASLFNPQVATAGHQEAFDAKQAQPFTQEEFDRALGKINTSTAPGPDQVSITILRQGTDKANQLCLKLINKSFLSLDVPHQWRRGRVILIRKKPRTLLATPCANYRPICITNIFARLVESMLLYRVETAFERFPSRDGTTISPYQFGFRPGRSTEEELAYVHHSVRTLVKRKKLVGLLSLDLRKAYDTCTLAVLRTRLFEADINIHIARYIWGFLRGRKFFVDVDGERSTWHTQREGLSQGAVLSPLLWALYINPLLILLYNLKERLPPHLRIAGFCAYADDIIIWFEGTSQEEVDNKIRHALSFIETWLQDNGMCLAEDKIGLIYFIGRRRTPIQQNQIIINNVHIEARLTLKILGVIWDQKLTWDAHIHYIRGRCASRVGIIKRLSATPTTSLRLLFIQYVQCLFTYGSTAWSFGVTAARWSKIEGGYSRAVKAVLGCGILTSAGMSKRLLGVPELIPLITTYWDKLITRISRCPQACGLLFFPQQQYVDPVPWYDEHLRIPQLRHLHSLQHYLSLACQPLIDSNVATTPQVRLHFYPPLPLGEARRIISLDLSLNSEVPQNADRQAYRIASYQKLLSYVAQGYHILIVDASYRDDLTEQQPRSAGYAWTFYPNEVGLIVSQGIRGQGPLGTAIHSSTEAELAALSHAIKDVARLTSCRQSLLQGGKLLIVSDSQGALKGLSRGWLQRHNNRQTVWECLQQLLTLPRLPPQGSIITITGYWLKAHVGLLLHDEVDRRAKAELETLQPVVLESWESCLTRLSQRKKRIFEQTAHKLPVERLLPGGAYVWNTDAIHLPSIGRVEQSLLFRLRLGVLPLFHPVLCPSCGIGRDSIQHFLLSCPALTPWRTPEFLSGIHATSVDHSMFMLLYSSADMLRTTLDFVHNSGRKI